MTDERQIIGQLKYDHINIRQTAHAIYFEIFFKDEDGKLFSSKKSSFLFELNDVG